jgi:hypothetical protein
MWRIGRGVRSPIGFELGAQGGGVVVVSRPAAAAGSSCRRSAVLGLRCSSMTEMGRRHFCALLGAGLAGMSAVLVAGCSSGAGTADTAVPGSTGGGGVLAGRTFAVRRDPG